MGYVRVRKVRHFSEHVYSPEEVRAIRMRYGLTFTDLHDATGIDRKSAWMMEEGRYPINHRNLRLYQLLDLYPEIFIEDFGRDDP